MSYIPKTTQQSGKRLRIAIVNDSLMAVESLRRVVMSVPDYDLVWVAYDGAAAVAKAAENTPDLILMDLIMPTMDGVTATRRIMAETPCAIVIITASVKGNSSKVFEAMGAGALDALNTPVLGSAGEGEGRQLMLRKLETIRRFIDGTNRRRAAEPVQLPQITHTSGECLLAIGASTGGPAALHRLLGVLPANLPATIAIVQHMDMQFIGSFVDWLNTLTPLAVRVAREGDKPIPGQVLVANSEDHLILREDGRFGYQAEPVDYPYRPSVNVFFESIAKHWRGHAAGVLLTGMGRDGANGLLAMRRQKFHTIAQDEGSCAVYGMPRAAATINAAADILPLDEIAERLVTTFKKFIG